MVGNQRRAIAEGFVPEASHGPEHEMTSHETVCVRSAGDEDARAEIAAYYADGKPGGPYEVTVAAERTEPVRSDVPVVRQHTRLDARRAANALPTTVLDGAG